MTSPAGDTSQLSDDSAVVGHVSVVQLIRMIGETP